MFPAQKIYMATARRIKRISRKIAKELNISGPFNIQYLAKDNDVKVIECNLRASRSFPFVSKVLKKNFIETATRIMLGEKVDRQDSSTFDIDYIGVKASQFSFARLHKADPVLGVDMSSTGEVGCLGKDFDEALLNAMISVGHHVPKGVGCARKLGRCTRQSRHARRMPCARRQRLQDITPPKAQPASSTTTV